MTREQRQTLLELPLPIVVEGLTRAWPEEGITHAAMRGMLADFITWMETQPDDRLLQFCWDVLSARPRRQASSAYAPLLWMKWSGRLGGGDIAYDAMELTITLLDEAEAMYWWPPERWRLVRWKRDSQQYLDAFTHASCLVRAAAARTAGELFFGCSTRPSAEPPQLPELMELIRKRERKTPGLAGPFLQGAHWSTDPFLREQPFDFRSWFLEMLRAGGNEPWVPGMQSLEFYAHEFFERDPAAIEELLKMGRELLALITATAAPDAIPELMPVLKKMAASPNPRISQAIRKYMVVRRRHAGVGAQES
jgi:hypothetical protein